MSLWVVYGLFFQFGLLCFGGGYVLVPLIVTQIVHNPDFQLSEEMFGMLLAIAQMTPGPIGLNTATFVGYMVGAGESKNVWSGIFGGIVGSAALLTPGYVLVILASYYLKRCQDSIGVKGVLTGIRPASVGLVWMAVIIFLGYGVFDGNLPFKAWVAGLWNAQNPVVWPQFNWGAALIMLTAYGLLSWRNINVIWLLLAAAAAGAIFLS